MRPDGQNERFLGTEDLLPWIWLQDRCRLTSRALSVDCPCYFRFGPGVAEELFVRRVTDLRIYGHGDSVVLMSATIGF